jgi:hypothetical protein
MSRIIYQQPDGLFAEFETITDTFIVWNATAEDLIQLRRTEASKEAEQLTLNAIERAKLKATDPDHFIWKQAVKLHNSNSPEHEQLT